MTTSKAERYAEYFREQYSHYARYHNHKERMAYAGMLLQVALGAGFVSVNQWPPEWLSKGDRLSEDTAIYWSLGFSFAIWFLTHIYVRWQLVKRRFAAIQVASTDTLLKELAIGLDHSLDAITKRDVLEEKATESEAASSELSSLGRMLGMQHIGSMLRQMAKWLDLVIPFKWNRDTHDTSLVGYPTEFVNLLRERHKLGTGALAAEWMMCIASAMLLAIIVARHLA